MMKKIGYCFLLLCLVLACVPELPVQPGPTDERFQEDAKVTIDFSVAGLGSIPSTKALEETPSMDSLYLAVFGSSGYLKEYVKANITHRPTYSGTDTTWMFRATLTLSDKERSIHFIGNGPSTIDFGYDYEILPQLQSPEGGQAFWQMLKSVFIVGEEQDGTYKPTQATLDQFKNIPLIRNFSKIVLETEADANFTPDSFAVFSVPARGSVVPFSGGKFIEDYQDYGFVDLSQIYPGNIPDSTDFVGKADEWESRAVLSSEAVYLYERPVPTDQLPPTFVIVHGTYNNPDDPNPDEHNGKQYYYKIDLMQDGEYYPILRNFKYKINIHKILSIGHTSAQAAAASAGSANVSADITTRHLNDISDGQARLVVQPWMSQTFNKRQVNNNLLHVKFFDDIMEGPNMDYGAVTCEILPIPGESDIIESATIGYPVQASGTEQGWRTVTFTTREPGAPGTEPRTQTLRIIGSYKTESGDKQKLYRDVLITLQPLQQFQLIVESDDAVAPYDAVRIPRETEKKLRLNVGIPTNLVESMFPLDIIIEPEDMSLTPDNSIQNNNLPVSAGTSISDHAEYAGKRAFQFHRSLSYDEYLSLPQSFDLDGNPIRVDICHFKTTRKDNATTIWVANEYFNKARVSYLNPPIRNLRFFYVESREDNIEQSVVTLQFSGKVQYLKNEDGWVSYTSNSELRMKNGDRIYFRGDIVNWYGANHFTVSGGNVNLGGNIASLFRDDFTEDDLPADYGKDASGKTWNFRELFSNELNIIDASALVLPMETMRANGYQAMFKGCKNLTAAPVLPATTLANYCYQEMFSGCTSLTTAPKLLAETLPQNCYNGMFSGCTSLNEITMTARTISNNNSLSNWVSGVAATGDFYGHVDKPNLSIGVNGIPTGWVDRNEFFVKVVGGGVLSFTGSGLQYSKNWDDWTSDGIASISVEAGDIVRFRGVRSGGTISSTGTFDVGGNILSLAGVDYTQKTTGSFTGLFKNATNLVSAARLVLPTELQADCFKELFSGCTSLTAPPALPATSLAPGCYQSMFQGCTSLAMPPALPATTLASRCYQSMFQGCTSLTSSPKLPAETLVDNCYTQMFSGCTQLNFVIISATGDISGQNYTSNWLENVAASGFILKPSGLILVINSNNGVPNGWSPDAPFFIEARNTCTVTISKSGVEYKIDGSPWQNYSDAVSLTTGQKMFIRATINDWSGQPVSVTGNFAIGGSLASLVKGNYSDENEAKNATGWTFQGFMSGKTNLVDASLLDMPMLTIGNNGYRAFFNGCTNLVTGPTEISATTIGQQGAYQMFYDCKKLIAPPVFKMTAYNKEACYEMFYNCTALQTIPSFSSTVSLTGASIFARMFQSCTSLTKLTEPLFNADMPLANACYQDMFAHCTKLTEVPDGFLPATTLAVDCYRGMFQDTGLTRAPDLLVPTLSWSDCYRYMFYGCKSLSYIRCLASNPSNTYTQNFTGGGVASSGTFVIKSGASWPSGANGIPSGWTVVPE